MKEIALPLYAELATRKLIGREGGSPELPEKLVLGDQVTCTLRLYERTSGELKERVPVVKSLRATLGKTLEPPTSGSFKLQLDQSTPASVTVNPTADGVLFAARVQIWPTPFGPIIFDAIAEGAFTGAFATIEESLAALRAQDPDEEFVSISEIEDGEFTVTVRAAGAHHLQFDCVDLDTANKTFEADGFNGAVTEAIAFDALAATVQTAIDDARVASVEKPAAGTWVVKTTFADNEDGWAPFLAPNSNALIPHSFVRIRPYTLAGFHWFEIRLIQAPLAATGLHERVLPDAPSVERIQEGGSASTNDDIEVNEIQALILPDDFRGTYVLGWDLRKTDLLGIDDGPEQIAAALNAMWKDGQTRFAVTNPESGKAYIEFVGPLADTSQALITATVKTFEPGVLTFTLDLATAELDAALRAATEITVPLEVEAYVLPDGEDPETSEEVAKRVTFFQQSFKVVREQAWEEMETVEAIDWLKPPQPRNYIPFSPGQIITGSQYYAAPFGNGALREFSFAHNKGTAAVAGITIRENADGGAVLTLGDDYTVTIESENEISVALTADTATPGANALAIVITFAGPASAFQAHNHTIAEITDLQDLLDELGARLTAIEDLLPTAQPTRDDSSSGTVQAIPIPDRAEVFPRKFAPDFNPESALTGLNLPPTPRLLPAIHDAAVTDHADDSALPAASTDQVWKLTEADGKLLLPGGSGRRSRYVLEDEFFGHDGRFFYHLTRKGTTTSFFPTDFERELFMLAVSDKMLRAGQTFTVTFDLDLALINATTRAQWFLVVEVGAFPSQASPATTAENLEDVTWIETPLLEQKIVVSNLRQTHKFGAAIARDAEGALSASKLLYGKWEGDAQEPASANFAIRARLVRFDTENSVTDERGYAFFALKNASAAIQ